MKLGIIVPNLGLNNKNFKMIQNINEIHKNRVDVDIIVFFENLMRPCVAPEFATMPLFDGFNYSGPLMATTLPSAYKLLKFTGSREKYFYIWDLEWILFENKNYESLINVYSNEKLKLITRNEHHKKIVENCWGREVFATVNDFDMEKLVKVMS